MGISADPGRWQGEHVKWNSHTHPGCYILSMFFTPCHMPRCLVTAIFSPCSMPQWRLKQSSAMWVTLGARSMFWSQSQKVTLGTPPSPFEDWPFRQARPCFEVVLATCKAWPWKQTRARFSFESLSWRCKRWPMPLRPSLPLVPPRPALGRLRPPVLHCHCVWALRGLTLEGWASFGIIASARRPSPKPPRFPQPSPKPRWTWPDACTSAHRSYSGLQTPLAFAGGEKTSQNTWVLSFSRTETTSCNMVKTA